MLSGKQDPGRSIPILVYWAQQWQYRAWFWHTGPGGGGIASFCCTRPDWSCCSPILQCWTGRRQRRTNWGTWGPVQVLRDKAHGLGPNPGEAAWMDSGTHGQIWPAYCPYTIHLARYGAQGGSKAGWAKRCMQLVARLHFREVPACIALAVFHGIPSSGGTMIVWGQGYPGVKKPCGGKKPKLEQHTHGQRALAGKRTPDCMVCGAANGFVAPHTVWLCSAGCTL